MSDGGATGGRGAGREPDECDLTRLVAAHVMGWEYRERFRGDTQGYFGSVVSEELPAFATEMGAAWQLIERLQSLGWDDICLWQTGRPRDGDGKDLVWYCGLARGREEAESDAATPARAICLAALRAVGKGWLIDGDH